MRHDELGSTRTNATKLAGLAAVGVITYVFASASLAFSGAGTQIFAPSVGDEFGKVAPLGRMLLTEWVLPFEMAAVLLLVGIVRAVVVAKRRL